eukprot:3664037-Amphidinium_carterae.1
MLHEAGPLWSAAGGVAAAPVLAFAVQRRALVRACMHSPPISFNMCPHCNGVCISMRNKANENHKSERRVLQCVFGNTKGRYSSTATLPTAIVAC